MLFKKLRKPFRSSQATRASSSSPSLSSSSAHESVPSKAKNEKGDSCHNYQQQQQQPEQRQLLHRQHRQQMQQEPLQCLPVEYATANQERTSTCTRSSCCRPIAPSRTGSSTFSTSTLSTLACDSTTDITENAATTTKSTTSTAANTADSTTTTTTTTSRRRISSAINIFSSVGTNHRHRRARDQQTKNRDAGLAMMLGDSNNIYDEQALKLLHQEQHRRSFPACLWTNRVLPLISDPAIEELIQRLELLLVLKYDIKEERNTSSSPSCDQQDTTSAAASNKHHAENESCCDEDQEPVCTICMESFQPGDSVIQLPCGHRFHRIECAFYYFCDDPISHELTRLALHNGKFRNPKLMCRWIKYKFFKNLPTMNCPNCRASITVESLTEFLHKEGRGHLLDSSSPSPPSTQNQCEQSTHIPTRTKTVRFEEQARNNQVMPAHPHHDNRHDDDRDIDASSLAVALEINEEEELKMQQEYHGERLQNQDSGFGYGCASITRYAEEAADDDDASSTSSSSIASDEDDCCSHLSLYCHAEADYYQRRGICIGIPQEE